MEKTPQGLVRRRQGYATELLRRIVVFFTPLRLIQLLSFLLVLICFLGHSQTAWVQNLDNRVFDIFLKAQGDSPVSPDIVYIGIDRKSLQSVKQFPWPKRYYAAMARILREWGAKTVVFNLFFSQAGDSQEDNEALLAEFKRSGNIYLPLSFESEGFRNYYYVNQSDSLYAAEARGIGHINYTPDPDGVIRRAYPYVKFNRNLLPHLGFRVAYDHLGKSVPPPAECALPLDRNNNLMIRWTKKWNALSGYYPFADILNGYAAIQKGQTSPIRPEDFKNRICLIGLTASDFKRTPLDAATPGIGVTGNIINMILTEDFIRIPSSAEAAAGLILVALAAGAVMLSIRGVYAMLAAAALAALWALLSFWLFSGANVWFGVVPQILLIALFLLISGVTGKIAERRERMYFLNLAARDELTGLYVMRYVSTFLVQAMRYAQTFRKPFAVILLDIDDFRKVNDVYGYRMGNIVLKRVAEVIRGAIRTKGRVVPDVAGRYGDEEFIVLLAGYNLATVTFGIAERIRKSLERIEFRTDKAGDPSFHVTVSAGVAVLKPGEKNPDKVVQRAREALLKAKASGKNQTAIQNS
ncbi:MAG: putative diguanylate cyclase YcdT [Candidatus Omnitrophica bacterium ADurb.Bin314]|jgi:diguanylate cyclase (GGDEF)-like protein|nr:MAG: putative diguanylate cyclase YcdT [Candidatus Omnitrophica bacterium ADurb.Bin314]